jgi:hypothetical protein
LDNLFSAKLAELSSKNVSVITQVDKNIKENLELLCQECALLTFKTMTSEHLTEIAAVLKVNGRTSHVTYFNYNWWSKIPM